MTTATQRQTSFNVGGHPVYVRHNPGRESTEVIVFCHIGNEEYLHRETVLSSELAHEPLIVARGAASVLEQVRAVRLAVLRA